MLYLPDKKLCNLQCVQFSSFCVLESLNVFFTSCAPYKLRLLLTIQNVTKVVVFSSSDKNNYPFSEPVAYAA